MAAAFRRAAAITENQTVEVRPASGDIVPWTPGYQPDDPRTGSRFATGLQLSKPGTGDSASPTFQVRPSTMVKVLDLLDQSAHGPAMDEPDTVLLHVVPTPTPGGGRVLLSDTRRNGTKIELPRR